MHLLRIVIAFALTVCACAVSAQFVSIPPTESGLFYRSMPTIVLVRPSPNARAVLVAIPGGLGRMGNGFRADMKAPPPDFEPSSSFAKILFGLAQPNRSGAHFNVVLFDNPYDMPNDGSTRGTADHLMRIENVIDYARDQFKLPVWIMGHSNGGMSITEVLKRLKSRGKEGSVAGIIVSASRNKAYFADFPMDIPALFMSNERDGCVNTPPSYTQGLAEKFRAVNKGPVEFVLVRGGSPESGDPCHTGTHMYHQADEEALRVIDDFAARQLK
jgi:hypothetical protein